MKLVETINLDTDGWNLHLSLPFCHMTCMDYIYSGAVLNVFEVVNIIYEELEDEVK